MTQQTFDVRVNPSEESIRVGPLTVGSALIVCPWGFEYSVSAFY
jgi:hypothetical protein